MYILMIRDVHQTCTIIIKPNALCTQLCKQRGTQLYVLLYHKLDLWTYLLKKANEEFIGIYGTTM